MANPPDFEKLELSPQLAALVIDMSQLLYRADQLLGEVKWYLAGGRATEEARALHARVHAWREEAGVEAARVIVTERRKALARLQAEAASEPAGAKESESEVANDPS